MRPSRQPAPELDESGGSIGDIDREIVRPSPAIGRSIESRGCCDHDVRRRHESTQILDARIVSIKMVKKNFNGLAGHRAASEVNTHGNIITVLPTLQITPDPIGVPFGLALKGRGKFPGSLRRG